MQDAGGKMQDVSCRSVAEAASFGDSAFKSDLDVPESAAQEIARHGLLGRFFRGDEAELAIAREVLIGMRPDDKELPCRRAPFCTHNMELRPLA